MENFIYHVPTKIYFGKGQIASLKEELPRYGKKALLVYGGGSIKRNGIYDACLLYTSRTCMYQMNRKVMEDLYLMEAGKEPKGIVTE